jgi:uncharacterized protein HemY
MSYPYRVRVSKTVEQSVDADDKVTNKLKLDDILSPNEMEKLLGEALAKRGYQEKEPGIWVKELPSGERREVDVKTRTAETTIKVADTIRKEKSVEVVGDAFNRNERDAQKERLTAEAESRLEKTLRITDDEVEQKRKDLLKKIGRQLEDSQNERTRELMEVVAEAQADAIKEKAKTLGNVVSLEERRSADGQEFELRIKISE